MNAYEEAMDKEGDAVKEENGDAEFFSNCQRESKWLIGEKSLAYVIHR
jgi:hypothetical protein